MVKFAYDTYVIIPATNVSSRQAELVSVELWSRANKVNHKIYAEIIFLNKRQKSTTQLPPPIQYSARVKVIRILGVTFNITGCAVAQALC